MKTYNTVYKDKASLWEFIRDNSIESELSLLIQVFSGIYTIKFIENLIKEILEILPNAKIIGGTTAGEIYEGKSLINSCVLSFSVFENTQLSTYAVSKVDYSSFKTGQTLGKNLVSDDTKLLILFATSEYTNGEDFLNGIDSVLKGVIVSGGLAGNNKEFSDAIVFNEREITKNGAVGVALNNKDLYVYTDFSFGWEPISKPLKITKSQGNVIQKIENLPAAEIYEKYLGREVLEGLPATGYEFPLMFERNGLDVSKVIVNNSDDGAFTFTSTVIEGERIRFGYGNLKNIIESANKTFERINEKPLESIFIYSCAARRFFLDTMIDKEMLPLANNTPVSGFFTFGEFNHTDNRSQFVSQTMTILGISESPKTKVSVDFNAGFKETDSEIISNKALYNLIQITVDELSEVNLNLEEKVKVKTKELRERFYTDRLTDLPNIVRIVKDLDKMFLPKLAIINVDSFREINEFYGHKAGDAVLLKISRKLNEFGKKNKLKVYRLPSDEFGLLADENITTDSFLKLMKDASHKIEKENLYYEDNELNINVTTGIVFNEDNMIEKANMALRYAKKHKESLKIYNDDLFLSFGYEKNLKVNKKILNAIKNGRITPYFQPIYNNETQEIEKYEALIRMIDEDGTIVSPIEFLEIAKKGRLYHQLTRIVINKTFETFKNTKYKFSINLSVEDILNKETKQLIEEKLLDKEIANRVIFEIVECEGIENFNDIVDFINELHSFGAKVAIDDFGTGYCNFEYMLKLKVDYIKIDGSMIKDIHKDKSSQLITECIVNFASRLGIETIAEFVHSKEVHKKVKDLGIAYSQGYYIGKPEPEL